MIKKFSLKKIYKFLAILLIVLLLQIFPSKEKYSLKTKRVFNENKYHEIYLLDKNNYIAKTKIVVNNTNINKLSKELLECLIIESKCSDRIPSSFKSILPSNTKINKIEITDDLIKVDFSNLFYETSNIDEERIIETIIYTLTSIKNINKVSITIDNNKLKKLPISNKNIDEILTRDYGINKEVNISSIKDIQNVTIYYVSKNEDNVYYVPVTKYINSDKNKINIIIEELSSRNSYNSNLMSYLNTNAKLINYEEKNNNINLNFNEYLFDNKNKKIVLEEVMYSISYSLNDSLNIQNVTFLVNNQEIKR